MISQYLLLLMTVVRVVPEIAESNAFADLNKTLQNQYFLNFPDGIFLASGQNHHDFVVDLATTPEDLKCDVDLALWSCSVLKVGKGQRVAFISLERLRSAQGDKSAVTTEEPTAVLKLTASSEGTTNSASTVIRAPDSQPRPLQSLQLRVLRNDNSTDRQPDQTLGQSGKSLNTNPKLTPSYTCAKVGEDSPNAFNGVEIFWLDDRGKLISRNQGTVLDATNIPSRTKSIKCAALGRRNSSSSFKDSKDSELGTVTYGVSDPYQLAEVFLAKSASNSDWIIWNGRPVTQTIEFKSLQPLPKGARISCYLGDLLQDHQLNRSVCENIHVATEGQTDFRVTVHLDPTEVAALWEIAERPGTLDRYSPRAINLRVINTGAGPGYFGDRELLVLRTNYVPTLAVRQLSTSRVSVSVQDPERDHIIVAAHEKNQKPWQSPASQLWSSWSTRRAPPSTRSDVHFEFEVVPGSSCQITASDGVLIATRACGDPGKNTTDHASESNHIPEESLLSSGLKAPVDWNKSPTGPRSRKILNSRVARFVSLVTPNNQRATIESLPHEESMRSGFCLGIPGKCDLFLARSGLVEVRTAQRFQAGLWMVGLDFANALVQLRLVEAFPDSASEIKNLASAKDLAEALSQKIRSFLLTKAESTRSSAKEAAETALQPPPPLEVVCVSAPELAQTCREIQSMLISLDSIFSTISFQIRSEIKGSRVILALLKQYQDETPAEVTGINKPILRRNELRNGLSSSSLIIGNLSKTKEK